MSRYTEEPEELFENPEDVARDVAAALGLRMDEVLKGLLPDEE